MTKKLFKGMKIAKLEKQMRIMMLSALFVMAGTVMTRAHSGDSQATAETQQSKVRIAGTVIDRNGDAVIGANIVEKNVVANGTTTDVDGKFSLSVSAGATLLVSYIGYVTQEIAVGNRTELQITLQEDLQALDEVVVVGYGTQKKVNLTGAVDMITYDQIKERPVSNVTEALQGASPNLNITTSEYSGEPGGTMLLNIRGVGSLTGSYSPYVLVDGMPMDLNIVNPNDIESISILKDAAASAIYGSRAPYGVILITTKKGSLDGKIKITYENNTSLSTPIGMPHMENSLYFMTALNQASTNAGIAPPFKEEAFDRVRKYMAGEITDETFASDDGRTWLGQNAGDFYGNANHDWFYDVYYRNLTLRQKHDASISGGSKNSHYFASISYLDQPDELRYGDQYYKRYNITANLTTKPADWLTFIINSKYINDKTQYFNGILTHSRQTMYHNFYRTLPFRALYLPNGEYSYISHVLPFVEEDGKERHYGSTYLATLGAVLEPIKNWKTQFNFNYRSDNTHITNFHPQITGTAPDGSTLVYAASINQYETSFAKEYYRMFNIVSSYDMTLNNEHYFYLMGGFEKEDEQYNYLYSLKKNVLVENIPSISTAVGDFSTDDNISHWATAGFFGRFQYNYKEKYLLEANVRYDGSSRFEEKTRWGLFPSFSAGYNISRESFWKPIEPYVNSFKIRASWGSLGNQNVTNYLYLPNMGMYTNLAWIMGSTRPSYTTAPALVSSDLTWETATTSNIAVDAGFLGNRLNLNFDLYRRLTTNMFGPSEALPNLLGASVPQSNNATLQTDGFELVLSWRDKIGKDITYNIKATLSDNVSTVKKYYNPTNILSTWYEGKKVGEIWGYTTDGIYQTDEEAKAGPDQTYFYPRWGAGDIHYKDMNGDGKINIGTNTTEDPGDLSIIGNNSPRYLTGLTLGAQWKGFDFSMFWQGVLKRDYSVGNTSITFWGFNREAIYNMNMFYKGDDSTLDYWRPADETNELLGPNTNAYLPKPYYSSEDGKNKQTQSRYILNSSYIRLKNLTVGYTLPKSLLDKVYMNNARVYLSGENLFTFTPLTKLIDPEALLSGYGGETGKVHFMRRVFSAGLSITF